MSTMSSECGSNQSYRRARSKELSWAQERANEYTPQKPDARTGLERLRDQALNGDPARLSTLASRRVIGKRAARGCSICKEISIILQRRGDMPKDLRWPQPVKGE